MSYCDRQRPNGDCGFPGVATITAVRKKEMIMSHHLEACIQACLDCHRSCIATAAHCLTKGGHHAEAEHIRIMSKRHAPATWIDVAI